jgi:hypothetical protein
MTRKQLACRTSAGRYRGYSNGAGVIQWKSPTMHVDCNTANNFLSFGIFKPPDYRTFGKADLDKQL